MSARGGEPHGLLGAVRRCAPCQPLPEDGVLFTRGSFPMPRPAQQSVPTTAMAQPATGVAGGTALPSLHPPCPHSPDAAGTRRDRGGGAHRQTDRQTGWERTPPAASQPGPAGLPVHEAETPASLQPSGPRPTLLPALPSRGSADPSSSHCPSPSRRPLLLTQLKGQGTLLHAPSTPACLSFHCTQQSHDLPHVPLCRGHAGAKTGHAAWSATTWPGPRCPRDHTPPFPLPLTR